MQIDFLDLEDRGIRLLRVGGELDWETRAEFQEAGRSLLESEAKKLAVDLSKVTRMSSVFIGTLVDIGHSANSLEKTLTVILPARMAAVVRKAGLEKIVHVVEA